MIMSRRSQETGEGIGMMEHCKKSNSKHQTGAPPRGWGLRRRNLRVSGVGCQVSGKKNKKTETPVFVIWNFYSSSTPKPLAIFTGKAMQL
jgi:hypothetical protein